MLCSSSTGEHCKYNVRVVIGTLIFDSLLSVDDIIDLSGSKEERKESHRNAMLFAKLKKLK